MTMPRRTRGFTLIEMMVAITILSILLAVGIPSMRAWMTSTRAVSAAEFYAEGMRTARAEALRRNAVSRLTLTTNASNGQQDWQVDICVEAAGVLCNQTSGTWSTPSTALTNTGMTDFKSVFRSAKNLPSTSQMTVSIAPSGATDVYFTPVGWVDGRVLTNLNRITIAPVSTDANAFPTTAIFLTGGGSLIKCNPSTDSVTIAAKDSRKCPTT